MEIQEGCTRLEAMRSRVTESIAKEMRLAKERKENISDEITAKYNLFMQRSSQLAESIKAVASQT